MKKALFLLIFIITNILSFAQSPVEINGKLSVQGYQLTNEDGFPVQLRGMSSHGLQWFGNCFTSSTFQTLKTDWGADIVRLAMYVESGGYLSDQSGAWEANIESLVNSATSQGLYVMIDWHILSDGDPLKNKDAAVSFFTYMAKKFKDNNNVIYEICNEPNGNGDASWSNNIRPYALEVIPAIRAEDPDGIIVVGTPVWSSKPGDVLDNPLPTNLQHNTMYTFHFYAGSHYTQAYINELTDQLPIFATEWGVSHYSGQGGNDYDNADAWLDLFLGNNKGKQLISWCNWSMADKDETSAALTPGACGNGEWNNTSESGTYIKNRMKEEDTFIALPLTSPKISVQPQDVSGITGQTVTVDVFAFGQGNLTYTWRKNGNPVNDQTSSTLTIDVLSVGDVGSYDVVITSTNGTVTSQPFSISISNQTPYNNTYQVIPGRIEMEFYDNGGDKLAYRDLETENYGYVFRTNEGVDVFSTTDDNSSYVVGSIGDNEWLEYSVDVTETAFYALEYRIASLENNVGRMYLEVDGEKASSMQRVLSTGGSSTFQTFNFNDTIELSKGIHLLRFTAENGSFDINYIEFKDLNIDCKGVKNGTAVYDDCGVCGGDNSTCIDCEGTPNGTAIIDRCGECNGDNSTCYDCEGVFGGDAFIDDCGVCVSGTTGRIENEACTDCNGDINGSAYLDDCGVCVGGLTGKLKNATCVDCEGVIGGGKVNDDCGVCGGNNSTCSTNDPDAYEGTPTIIPGTLQAENYDVGGASVSYSDSDDGNNGNAYRTDDVDISSDGDGTFLGWSENGEWTVYTVQIKYAGNYDFTFRGGANGDNRNINVYLDDELLIDGVTVTNVNSYSVLTTFTVENITLPEGKHKIKLEFNNNSINTDYIEIEPRFSVDCKGIVNGIAVLDDCGICGGDNSTCSDCKGIAYGTAFYDNCDNCVSTIEEACQADCQGIYDGTTLIDDCGICNGDGTACVVLSDNRSQTNLFGIYPNPTSGVVHFSNETEYDVRNILGEELLKGKGTELNLQSLPSGIYLIETEFGVRRIEKL